MFGDVIFGRAKAACHQDQADPFACILQRCQDMLPAVGDAGDLMNPDAHKIQLFGNPCRIGVDHLADQQFISDGNYFCYHNQNINFAIFFAKVEIMEAFRILIRRKNTLSRRPLTGNGVQ
jgi:hypothetical protein